MKYESKYKELKKKVKEVEEVRTAVIPRGIAFFSINSRAVKAVVY